MKKVFAVLLSLVLLLGVAHAEGLDYASMTDDQLHAVLDAVRNELTRRELVLAENTVLVDQDGVQVYLTGNVDYGITKSYVAYEVVVINNTDKIVNVGFHSASLNGWDVDTYTVIDIPAGKKKKGKFQFSLADASLTTYEEVQELELSMYLYDDDYDTFAEIPTVTLHPNAQ